MTDLCITLSTISLVMVVTFDALEDKGDKGTVTILIVYFRKDGLLFSDVFIAFHDSCRLSLKHVTGN